MAPCRFRLASRLRRIQCQPFPPTNRYAVYRRPGEASPPRDPPGGIDRLSQKERHQLRRAVHLVVISFAPKGASAAWWAVFPVAFAMGYDLLPASRANRIYGMSGQDADAGESGLMSVPQLLARRIRQRILPSTHDQ